jgi:AbrB family looped-hinge helix DNA binding protein
MQHCPAHTLYGITTVGPKGQVVIPVEARKRLGIEPGDKIVVLGQENKPKIIGLCSEEMFQTIIASLGNRLDSLSQSYHASLQKEKE